MFEVGQTVTLTASPLDTDRDPYSPDDMQVLVTLPDGTDSGPQNVTPDSVGEFHYDYPTVQAGRHVVRWTGDGYAYSDVFNVWPEDPRFLISTDDARRSLRTQFTGNDDDIRFYIAAVTPVIEDIVGPVGGREYTQTFDGSNTAIVLPYQNVAVTEVTIDGVASTNFTLDPVAGILYAGTGYAVSRFGYGRQNVSVTYTAGLTETPPNVLLAAKEEFRFLWQIGQEGQGFGFNAEADETVFTPSGFAVPRRVIELCGPHMRGPVVA